MPIIKTEEEYNDLEMQHIPVILNTQMPPPSVEIIHEEQQPDLYYSGFQNMPIVTHQHKIMAKNCMFIGLVVLTVVTIYLLWR